MAWIRVDQSLRDHRKVITLASELGVSQAAAVGHVVLLWLWCLDNAPTGILKRINGQQIATACAWRRNPNGLVNALLTAGFLEKCGRGGISLRIHDWHEYMGKLLDARAAHRDRMQRARAALRNSTVQDSTVQDSREVPLQGSPKRGTGRRRRKDDGQPLSGKFRDKVQH